VGTPHNPECHQCDLLKRAPVSKLSSLAMTRGLITVRPMPRLSFWSGRIRLCCRGSGVAEVFLALLDGIAAELVERQIRRDSESAFCRMLCLFE
jgi:hypothetical protein